MKALKENPIPRSMKCWQRTTSTDGKTRSSKSFLLHNLKFRNLPKSSVSIQHRVAVIQRPNGCQAIMLATVARWALGRHRGAGRAGTPAAGVVQVIEIIVIVILNVNVDFLIIVEWRHRSFCRRWRTQAV